MEDLTGKAPAPGGPETQLTSTEWNNFFQELKNLITPWLAMAVGDLQQLGKVIVGLITRANFFSSSGTSSAYTLTVFGGLPAPPSLGSGTICRFRPHVSSIAGTASLPTVNLTGLGAIHVTREDGSLLQAGDLTTTRDAHLRYDAGAAKWRLLNGSLGAPPSTLPVGYIDGLTLLRNTGEHGSTPTEFRDVLIQTGRCRDAGDTMDMVVATALAKRFDANVAAGTGAGGWPNATLGARAVSTWYRVFIIGDSNSGATDAGFDSVANADASALIADYNAAAGATMDSYRQIGWVRTTSGSNVELEPFMNDSEDPSLFLWTGGAGYADWDRGSPYPSGTAAQELATLDFAPPESMALLNFYSYMQANSGVGAIYAIIQPVGHPDVTPLRTINTFYGAATSSQGAASTPSTVGDPRLHGMFPVRVDSNRQFNVRVHSTGSGARVFAHTVGFRFER